MTWVRLYTLGMERATRERRLGEIASDLWEQQLAADARDASSIAGRFVRGVPADIAWRIDHSMHVETDDDLIETWPGLIAVLVVLGIGIVSVIYAALHAFGVYAGAELGYAFVNVGLLIASLVLLRGLSMTSESPRKGAAIVLVVGLGMAFLWAWMPPIAIALLLVVAYGMKRAGDASHARPTERAIPRNSPEDSS
jgi:hypothetical protein